MQRIFGIFSLCLALGPLLTLAAVQQEGEAPEERIIAGHLAEPKQFPYQAGLLLYKAGKEDWCGGALISSRWVLTAALCTYDLGKGLDLYLGTWNRLDKLEKGQQIIYVANNPKNVIVHEEYSTKLDLNDIALVKIPAHVGFNEYVQPLQLPTIEVDYVGIYANTCGWGAVQNGDPITDKLRFYPGLVVTNVRCNEMWLGRVLDDNVCAMNSGTTTCTGDTGGPLVPRDTNILIGIATFHLSLCMMKFPMVFTRVTSYLDWIKLHSGVVP